MILSKSAAESGTTLAETAIAACTAALFLGSLFTMNIAAMKTIRTARDAASASQVLQQRVEAMRIANWHQITNPDWISGNLLNTSAAGSQSLKEISETLTITPYDGTTSGNTYIVRSGGTTEVKSRNTSLLTENALKLTWTVSYTGGINARPITRQAVAVVAKGGVAKW